ncbi:MAG TPA: aldehyde ferredoxin oxidoreductase family protein [Sedimentibacter sp.]|jgi:aldehyde:ferredoxin oxidoreductase|nr:aldehyde ferredoxin oxidoreductase family protein [Sedimentibacter sp.]HOW22455.1 aldehyde ferredoxin oxidoreductase family protein [Sedimentibacter sp.]HRC81377.1 aldehyde ferredoxin oxidoreductase family protein [Sedimentibacter sp.]
MRGYTEKIIRVDLTNKTIKIEKLNMDYAKEYIGGRGLATKYLYEEIDPQIDPLSPENKLIFMTGPVTGTNATCAGRFNVVAKAPLTGTIGAANSGGYFGPELKFAGYDGIIFEGKANSPVYLHINDDLVELKDASHVWGKDVFETTDILLSENEEDAKVACIGPAGEKLVLFAAVMNDKDRAAGRSGLGAVMGSKNLKAVVVKGTKGLSVANPMQFNKAVANAREKVTSHAVTGTGGGLATYGTEILVNILNEMHAFPTNNWQASRFEEAEKISGEYLTENYLVRNKACFACPIGCGRTIRIPDGKYKGIVGGPEYEAGWSYGASCGISDLNEINKANHVCNMLGLDPITMGATIACAMELFEKGYISKEDLDGEELRFGDALSIMKLTEKTGYRQGFGDKLALGSYRLAEMYGHPELSMTVKKQEMPAYDGRAIQGMGLSYATSNRGGCHVRGYVTSTEVLGIPMKTDPLSTEGKPALLKLFQDLTALVDSSDICLFTTFAIGLPEVSGMLRGATGFEFTDEEMLKIGERIWNLEKLFNIEAGLTREDDMLPPRLLKEPVTSGPSKGKVTELQTMLDEYYQVRGWDEYGVPTEEKLNELSISSRRLAEAF